MTYNPPTVEELHARGLAHTHETRSILEAAHAQQRVLCIAWFRQALKKHLGAEAPESDPDLVTVALARGYECVIVTPMLGDDVTASLRLKGKPVDAALIPRPVPFNYLDA